MTNLFKLPSKRPNSKSLLKAIFEADSPERAVQELPAQSLYIMMRSSGLAACSELIEITPIEKLRTCLDLDLWEKDSFHDDSFWEWLSLSDESEPLKFTQRILRAVDLKLIGLLIIKYTDVLFFDEQTENPPAPKYYTPDKGFTWVNVTLEDTTKHFYFTRFLALLFETDSKVFYQLIAVPGVSTVSLLEEESYQERNKRLAAEGVPEPDFALELNSVLAPHAAKEKILAGDKSTVVCDIPVVHPILYDADIQIEPLTNFLKLRPDQESTEAELTLICNASIVFFKVPYYEFEAVKDHTEKVKGLLNIGLEKALTLIEGATQELIAQTLSLTDLYRLGLFEILELRKKSFKITDDQLREFSPSSPQFVQIAYLREPLPVRVLSVAEGGAYCSKGAFMKLKEVEAVAQVLLAKNN